MTNRILVTGASGNIGRPLVEALKAQNAVFSIMRSKPDTGSDNVETRYGDFGNIASLTEAFTEFDTVFLLFPLVPNKLELAQNAAAAAKAAGVKHIVRSSGAGADSKSPFALPKLQGEIDDVLAATGIATTFLRPASFMQNYVSYQTQAIKDGTIYMADGGQAQSLIDVRDIAAVAAVVLTRPEAHAGKAYTVTGGLALTGAEAAAIISAAIAKPVSHVSVATDAAVATMNQWGMPPFIVNVMDSLNKIVAAGYASQVSPDVEHLLGRKPRSFAAFAQENAGSWK